MVSLIIVALVLVLLALALTLVFLTYRDLGRLRKRCEEAWRAVDIQLRQHHAVTEKLLKNIAPATQSAQQKDATVAEALGNAEDAREIASVHPGDEQALKHLESCEIALAEAYSNLPTVESCYAEGNELPKTRAASQLKSSTHLVAARRSFADAVDEYNAAREGLLGQVVAEAFGFFRMHKW